MRLKSLLTAFLAVFFLVSCDSDNDNNALPDGNEQETKNVFLKFDIDQISNLRATEPTASGTKASLMSALIYFVDGQEDAVVYAVEKINYSGEGLTISDLTKGVKFEKIPTSVKSVYIVGNYNSSDENGTTTTLPTHTGAKLSDIKGKVLDIQQVAYPRLADGTQSNTILTVLDGIGEVKPYASNESEWNGEGTPAADDAFANVSISPINARIEVNKLSYTGNLTSFTMEGIYVNRYYATMPLGLSIEGLSSVQNGLDRSKYELGGANFAYTVYKNMFDTIDEDAELVNEAAGFAPADLKVWAYHVFGNHNPTPQVILKLTNVVDVNGIELGERFVTVKGFIDQTGVSLSSLERGKLYQIKNLAFNDSHLGINPSEESISLWIHVQVEAWETVEVTPDL